MNNAIEKPDKSDTEVATPSEGVDGQSAFNPDIVDLRNGPYGSYKGNKVDDFVQEAISVFLGVNSNFFAMNMFQRQHV